MLVFVCELVSLDVFVMSVLWCENVILDVRRCLSWCASMPDFMCGDVILGL